MILHLLTDDKFADYAIKQYSSLEKCSNFVLVPSNSALHLVKEIDKCAIVYPDSPEFSNLVNDLSQYTGVIFHGLFWGSWQKLILESMPRNVKVGWYFWGGEIYSRHELDTFFMATITRAIYNFRQFFKRRKVDISWEIPLELFNRIDYCLTSIPEECDYAKQFTRASFEHLWYTCYSLEETVGSLMTCRSEGNNVMLGNSAAIKNNHFDLIWKFITSGSLKALRKNKVIIPLSYGDGWVRNLMLKIGRFLFGNRMQCLQSYMPLKEYNSLMLTCSTMILGYIQPAGQGNIITALWLGMRVYLFEDCIAYKYFKRIGAHVFSIESDLKKYKFTSLSDEERTENRRVLSMWYSKENVMNAVQNVVNTLQ